MSEGLSSQLHALAAALCTQVSITGPTDAQRSVADSITFIAQALAASNLTAG